MGRQIIKCPDGKYNIFSTVSDMWVLPTSRDAEWIVAVYRDEAAERAEKEARGILAKIKEGRDAYFQFTMSFKEANDIDKKNRKSEKR